MTTSSTDFRKIINLIETTNNDALLLSEGPLLNRGLAALGSNKAQGRVDRDQLAKPMLIGFKKFLGRTNRSGTLADVQAYLGQIGFTAQQAEKIVSDHSPYVDSDNDTDQSNTGSNDNTQGVAASASATPPTANSTTTTPTDDQNSAAPDPSVAGAAAQPVTPTPTSTRTTASAAASAANPVSDNIRDLQNQKEDFRNKYQETKKKREDAIGLRDNPKTPQDKRDEYNKQVMDLWRKQQEFLNSYKETKDKLDKMPGQSTPASDQSRENVASSYKYSGNILNELFDDQQVLSRGQISTIFTSAAAYAHDNNLVKSRVGKLVSQPNSSNNSNQGNPYGGYSNTVGSSSSGSTSSGNAVQQPSMPSSSSVPSTPKGAAQNAIDSLHNDMFSICKREGMSTQDIQSLKDAVRSKSRLAGITDAEQKNLLSLIGFAFLKTVK
jgi:hypothetical protein